MRVYVCVCGYMWCVISQLFKIKVFRVYTYIIMRRASERHQRQHQAPETIRRLQISNACTRFDGFKNDIRVPCVEEQKRTRTLHRKGCVSQLMMYCWFFVCVQCLPCCLLYVSTPSYSSAVHETVAHCIGCDVHLRVFVSVLPCVVCPVRRMVNYANMSL